MMGDLLVRRFQNELAMANRLRCWWLGDFDHDKSKPFRAIYDHSDLISPELIGHILVRDTRRDIKRRRV
jgi:hypothetical protein